MKRFITADAYHYQFQDWPAYIVTTRAHFCRKWEISFKPFASLFIGSDSVRIGRHDAARLIRKWRKAL